MLLAHIGTKRGGLQPFGCKYDCVRVGSTNQSVNMERISRCLIESASIRSYRSEFAPPKVLEHIGGPERLFDSHEDDTPDVLKSRSEVFHKQTEVKFSLCSNPIMFGQHCYVKHKVDPF
nr:adenylate kinase 4-like [Tanacetum cinerariifolium]